jgi:hypothetical protein
LSDHGRSSRLRLDPDRVRHIDCAKVDLSLDT